MGGLETRVVLRAFAAIASVLAVVWLALWYFIPAPPSTITIATAFKGSAYERWALSYRERLSRSHVKVNLHYTDGPLDDIRLIKEQSSGIDVAFTFGGVTNSEQSPELMSLGRISFSPVWIFYRGTETLERLTQLKSKRIAVPAASRVVIDPILAAHGVNPDNTTMLTLPAPVAAKALKDGVVDVIVVTIELSAPFVQALLRDPTVRLMSVAQAEALTRVYPFLVRLVLPQGVIDFERNIPANDVDLIANTNTVLVRKTLHPELVYLLAQTLQEEHNGAGIFQRAGDFPTATNPEFPVAEGALDYYRNGPSFLQRYLPFWMINYAKRVAAILVAAVAIIIPLFTYTPRLYAWFVNLRLAKLYRRIRLVNSHLKSELTADQLVALQGDLENIDRAANILPMRHSELFLNLLMHIRFTRTELAARRDALRGSAI